MERLFEGNLVILGSGSISRCLQDFLIKYPTVNLSKIVVISADISTHPDLFRLGAQFIQAKITKENYKSLLDNYLKPGDLLIDLALDISTAALIDWCQEHAVLFLNTALSFWPDQESDSFCDLQMQFYNHAKKWSPSGPTALVEHGANPGLVSHWVKALLEHIAADSIKTKNEHDKKIENLLANQHYPELAYELKIKLIQIAEHDMQRTNVARKPGEFVNTWSIEGLFDECNSKAELTWSNDEILPTNAVRKSSQIILNTRGMDSWAYAWTPSGQILGMILPHEDVFSIGNYFTFTTEAGHIHRPTVLYVYVPCDEAWVSLHECRMNNYQLLKEHRLINEEIATGNNELGVLLHTDKEVWWLGSELSIEQTRTLIGGHNATTLQVVVGLVSGMKWLFKNPKKGLQIPDNLPYREIFLHAKDFLGTQRILKTNWRVPEINEKNKKEKLCVALLTP